MQYQVPQPESGARLRGMGGHGGGERVGGIDHSGDVVLDQPVPQTLDTAEAAHPHWPDRQCRVGNPAGQRTDQLDVGVQPGSQVPSLAGAAQ